MVSDISFIIKGYSLCNKPHKYKCLKGKKKIILDNDPYFRYKVDLWELPKLLKISTGYNYVLDAIDHFSK